VNGDVIPFNPLDKTNLAASVAEALLARPVVPLGAVPAFMGAGIYAIYYVGNFEAYRVLAEHNKNQRFAAPIYVGKAVPAGARKGRLTHNAGVTRALALRLAEHADSVRAAPGLNIEDFFCRYLVVDDVWIPLGESLLIARFAPIWNTLIDGFGNHDPGAGRYNGMRPRWDVLHSGRGWADKCASRPETPEQIIQDVENHLRSATFPGPVMIQPNAGQPTTPN
jgi:hypothetical protein